MISQNRFSDIKKQGIYSKTAPHKYVVWESLFSLKWVRYNVVFISE